MGSCGYRRIVAVGGRQFADVFHVSGFAFRAGIEIETVHPLQAFDWSFVELFGFGLAKQRADQRDVGFAYRVAQEAVVPDAGKTFGQHLQKKAAKELGRRFVGIEINPEYVDICHRRIAQEVLNLFPDNSVLCRNPAESETHGTKD